MEEEKLNERAFIIGDKIMQRFFALQQEFPGIGDVRGLGAMVGVEFVFNGDPRQPNGSLCDRIIKECSKRGLILLSAGTFKNVIRILSPLVITDEQLEKGLNIIEDVIRTEIYKEI